jgi:hypothetical protein
MYNSLIRRKNMSKRDLVENVLDTVTMYNEVEDLLVIVANLANDLKLVDAELHASLSDIEYSLSDVLDSLEEIWADYKDEEEIEANG